MKCFCSEVPDYKCTDCEDLEIWNSLTESEKKRIGALYELLLKENITKFERNNLERLLLWAIENNLTASIYPGEKNET